MQHAQNYSTLYCSIITQYDSRPTSSALIKVSDYRLLGASGFAYIERRNFFNKKWIREKERIESSKVVIKAANHEEGQWPKEKGQDDIQWSTKQSKDRATRTQ